MLHLLMILGWVLVFGCWVYLVARALKFRASDRREKKLKAKKIREFKKHHHFDDKLERWVRNVDRAVLPAPQDAIGDRRRRMPLFWLMLFLWESYWVSEIAERFSEARNPWQLPYLFLFIVLVVIPLVVYQFWRRM